MATKFHPKNRPLSEEERERLLKVCQHRDLLDQLAGIIPMYTGLQTNTLAHLRSDWLTEHDDNGHLEIFIPGYEIECNLGGRQAWGKMAWGQGKGPCGECQKTEGVFEAGLSARRIPVAEPKVQNILKRWFTLYDKVISPQTLGERIRSIGDAAEINRLTATVLRHTFGVILVEKGFDWKSIRDLLGFSTEIGGICARRYGCYVEGFNPFRCGAQTGDGERCMYKTKTRDARCRYHQDSAKICGVENRNGEACQRPVDSSSSHCSFHTGDWEKPSEHICGAENAHAKPCQRPVNNPNETCLYHS
jgi:hypothetical protein